MRERERATKQVSAGNASKASVPHFQLPPLQDEGGNARKRRQANRSVLTLSPGDILISPIMLAGRQLMLVVCADPKTH